MNQPPPPPPYSMPMPVPQPIGFEQPPPPLNAGAQQMPMPNYGFPSGAPYGTDPLVHQQQSRIAALNATPRPYYSGWRGSYGNRKAAMIFVGVVGLIIIIIFLVLFFTVFNKANDQFEQARKRQEEFHDKYFSNW